jgi:hypothetical protein
MDAAPPAARTRTVELSRAGWSWHWLLLPVAVVLTLALQITTINYYYYFDDYVPFAEIVREGPWSYVGHLLTSTDVTPNWRPLPGLLYLGSYQAAGMDPLPVRITTIAMHLGTVVMLYHVVNRTTGHAWAAWFGALVFGMNPAYVGALSQVTTATQVMAGFFLVATLACVTECARTQDRSASNLWLAAATLLFILAIGSHEGMAIMFPAYGVAFLLFDDRPGNRWIRSALCTAPLAIAGLTTALAFTACQCNEGAEVWGTNYAWRQMFIYLGRLLYPVGLELPTDITEPHKVAALALLLIMGAVVIGGPRIGRVGVAWVLLSVAPHVFIQYFVASRYLYMPAIGLGLVAASVAIMLERPLSRLIDRRAIAVVATTGALALFMWYGHQTMKQDEHFADTTGAWRDYHRDVTRLWPDVPRGTHVITIGGPFQKYEYQLYILPAFAETTWGEDVTIQDYEPGSLPAQLALSSGSPYVAEYRGGDLVQLFPPQDRDGGR